MRKNFVKQRNYQILNNMQLNKKLFFTNFAFLWRFCQNQ